MTEPTPLRVGSLDFYPIDDGAKDGRRYIVIGPSRIMVSGIWHRTAKKGKRIERGFWACAVSADRGTIIELDSEPTHYHPRVP